MQFKFQTLVGVAKQLERPMFFFLEKDPFFALFFFGTGGCLSFLVFLGNFLASKPRSPRYGSRRRLGSLFIHAAPLKPVASSAHFYSPSEFTQNTEQQSGPDLHLHTQARPQSCLMFFSQHTHSFPVHRSTLFKF